MIVLNSISKVVGRRQFKKIVLDDVNWRIRPRTHVVILGHPRSGAPELMNIIAGRTVPTSGWVDRRATVSVPGGLLRYTARNEAARQLIARLSRLYRVDSKEVSDFVSEGLGRSDVLDFPPRALPQQIKQQLNTVLTYAFPCDFYLFDNISIGGQEPRFQTFCERVLELRGKAAGFIMRASSGKAARRADANMMGALVYRGSLTLYQRLTDAITVFDSLPPEEVNSPDEQPQDEQSPQIDEDVFF